MLVFMSYKKILPLCLMAAALMGAGVESQDKFDLKRDFERAVCKRVGDGLEAFSRLDIYTGANCVKDAVYNTALIPVRGGFALAGIEGKSEYDPNETKSFPVTHYSTDWSLNLKKSGLDALVNLILIPITAVMGPEIHSKPVFEQAAKSFNTGDVLGGTARGICGVVSVPIEYGKALDWLAAHSIKEMVGN